MIEIALGLIEREGRWFLQRRDLAAKVLPGLWEFPGGKVELGEVPALACRRELTEEVGISECDLMPRDLMTHDYGDRRVILHAFQVSTRQEPRTRLAWGWFTPQEILRLPIPAANGPLVDRLAAHGVD